MKTGEFVQFCPLGHQAVDRVRVVFPANGHACEQHLTIGRTDKSLHSAWIHRPTLLRARIQTFLAQQQHQRLKVHAEIGPLRQTRTALDKAKQPDRGVEKPEISGEPFAPRLAVAALDP
jgi:hypothetical protein